MLNQKRLRQAHLFTLFLRISIPSNWESSDVALVRISEKVKQSDIFVYLTTKYASLLLLSLTVTVTLLLPCACSQMTIVISSSVPETGF